MERNSVVNLQDFVYKPDTFGTIRAMGIDKYPGEMPIVREILQNADDADSAKIVRFRINENEIIVENDGRPFTKPDEVEKKEDSDFFRISHIGLGKTKEEMTGTFGVGFTSVFHITDFPRIVSNGWDFEIHVDDVPSIKLVPFDPITRLHLPLRLSETEFSKKIKAEPFGPEKLQAFEKEIINEAYRDIFHLKTVKKIEAYKNGVRQFSISKKVREVKDIQDNVSCEQAAIQVEYKINGREKRRIEEWTIYSLGGIDIPSHLFDLGQTLRQKVSIAIPLNFKGKKITKGFSTENYAYYTLPVMPTGFNFRYNASKLYTTSGRSEFVTKEGLKLHWNLWQMDNLAKLLIHVVEDLMAKGTDPKIVYQIVPISSQMRPIFDERIFNSFKAIVVSNKIPLFYASTCIWREKDGTFMNWNGIQEVLPEDSGYHLISSNLRKYATVFNSYDIGTIGIEEFVEYLERKYGNTPFQSGNREDPRVIEKVFEYLEKIKIDPRMMERLKKICILLTEEGILRSYEYGVYFPTDEKMPLIDKDDILNHLTYNTPAAKRFLERRMKIKRIDLHHLILDSFLRRIGSYNDNQKFEFMWYLAKHQRDILRKKDTIDQLQKKLREIVVFEKSDDSSGPIFFADSELKEVFGSRLSYLDPRFEEQGRKDKIQWRNFLKRIGVEKYPNPEEIIAALKAIESTGFSEENLKKVSTLLKFLEAHWRVFYSKHSEELSTLNEFKWVPTNKNTLDYPSNVYVKRSLLKFVGENQLTISVKAPKNRRLIRTLGLLTELRLDDVVEFVAAMAGEANAEKVKAIPFAVYSFLDKKTDSLTSLHLDTLKNNKTIWLKGKLWMPCDVFQEDCRNYFGPNGWLRAYVLNTKFSRLERLCYRLGISRSARSPEDYIKWLSDVAEDSDNGVLEEWKSRLVHNAYSKLALIVNSISDDQLENLRHKKVMLTSESLLVLPDDCYLLRRGEGMVHEKLEKSSISVPIVKAENAEHEKLCLRLGVKELAYSLYARRVDKNVTRLDQNLTEKFNAMVPWLDGFEYSSTGTVSERNLIFSEMKVYRVSGLQVLYSIRDREDLHNGNSIEDLCCFERNEENILYLDERFSLERNEHIHLLSLNLTRDLSPAIDKIGWNLALASLLYMGKIIGVSPYDRVAQKLQESLAIAFPEPRQEPTRVRRLRKLWNTEEKPLVTSEAVSKEELDELLDEATQVMEEEYSRKTVDIGKMYSEKKHISEVRTPASVRYSTEPKIIAPKNWKLKVIDGEEVYIEEGIALPSVSRIRDLRRLTRKLVEVMGLNPETVNICVANAVTDGYNEEKQLFFNAAIEDSPCRWFGVVARELAYNYSHRHYPHVKAMIDLISIGLENIELLLPEFERIRGKRPIDRDG